MATIIFFSIIAAICVLFVAWSVWDDRRIARLIAENAASGKGFRQLDAEGRFPR